MRRRVPLAPPAPIAPARSPFTGELPKRETVQRYHPDWVDLCTATVAYIDGRAIHFALPFRDFHAYMITGKKQEAA